jgi:hypothetical protein
VLLAWPFSWLSSIWADAAFAGFGAGVLAYAHARSGPIERPAVVAFCSAAIAECAVAGQWSALLLGAALLSTPLLGGALLACKPTTALWLLAARPSWRAVLGGLCFVAISLIVRPTWPLEWWTAIHSMQSYVVIPATLPSGLLVLGAAALRWRRPEARLLLVMLCVPHSTFIYETLPLIMLVPRSWREAWTLSLSSWICYIAFTLTADPLTISFDAAVRMGGMFSLWGMYTPCALMLLSRQNVAVDDAVPSFEWFPVARHFYARVLLGHADSH